MNFKQMLTVCAITFGSIALGYFLARVISLGNMMFYPLDRMDMGSVLDILLNTGIQVIVLVIIVAFILISMELIRMSDFKYVVLSGVIAGMNLRYLVTLIKYPFIYVPHYRDMIEPLLPVVGMLVILSVVLVILAVIHYYLTSKS